MHRLVATLWREKGVINIDRLNWNNLRVYLVLARTGSLSQTGRQLGMDHSTVGRRIATLEHEIGTPLFDREATGYRVNAKGREFFSHVESMEASVLAIADQLTGEGRSLVGEVRIGTMEGIASLYLSEQFALLKEELPGIVVELVTSTRDVRVSQREADIFLGFFEPDTENLRAEKIGAFSCYLYGSPAYFARHGVPGSVESLSQHVFVGYIENLIQLDAVRWLENGVKDPTIVYRSNSMISQMFAAVAGTGLVMLPVFSRPERFGLLPVLHDRVRVHRDVWMSTLRHFPRVPRINAVLSFLTSIFARDYPPAA